MKITQEETKLVLEWLLSDDTGSSSKALCAWMLGIDYDCSYPSDKWDRGRCIRLLQLIPSWINRLDEMKTVNRSWEDQIELIKQELKLANN